MIMRSFFGSVIPEIEETASSSSSSSIGTIFTTKELKTDTRTEDYHSVSVSRTKVGTFGINTIEAGAIAGLEVAKACALSYGFSMKAGETNILVFHLGGHRLDVTVLKINNGVFTVLSTNGDTHVGGENFDHNLMKYFLNRIKNNPGNDIKKNSRALANLHRECERAKRALSSDYQVRIEIESLLDGFDFSTTLTRARFEELNTELFMKIMEVVKKSVDDADLHKSQIDEILLVGGSSRIPKVEQLLQNFFYGKEFNNKTEKPDEAVAYDQTKSQVFTTCQGHDTTASIQVFDGVPSLTKDLTGIPLTPMLFPYSVCSASSMEEDIDGEPNSDDESTGSYLSYLSDNEENEHVDPEGIMMYNPRRTPILDKLPTLWDTPTSTSISLEQARACLSEERYVLLTKENPENISVSDSSGRLYVVLETRKLPAESILPSTTRKRYRDAAGFVRDQQSHLLCWEFAVGDLISSTRVLNGLDQEFEAMCPMYLSQLAAPDMFDEELKPGETHRCFGFDGAYACELAKRHGVVKGNPKEIVCTQRIDFDNQEKYFIKDYCKHKNLEDAWIRLKTTPVAATLTCFTGWNGHDIYRGPLTKNAKYESEHEVIIYDITEIEGESVAICKSSNGLDVGRYHDGFIVVSLQVMVMLAGASREKDAHHAWRWCHIRPQYLLYDFLSIELETEQQGEK